jgi:hypothetical protein
MARWVQGEGRCLVVVLQVGFCYALHDVRTYYHGPMVVPLGLNMVESYWLSIYRRKHHGNFHSRLPVW